MKILVVISMLSVISRCTSAAVNLIIDTDMSTDVDDVGAVCIANAMMNRGEANLLAVVHNTGIDHGVGAISTLLTYYQRPNVVIGAYMGDFDYDQPGPYVEDLANNFPNAVKNRSQVPDAVTVYRTVLSAQADNSVVVSSIGFTTNLEPLLKSPPDAISSLSGVDLVRKKVRMLAWMGGKYPSSNGSSPEWNFGHNGIGNSTKYVYDNWPAEVPIAFSGFELGVDVLSGGVMTKALPDNNPCRKAYIDFVGPNNNRSSWDLITTMYGVRGNLGNWSTSVAGVNHVLPDGNNYWTTSKLQTNQPTKQWYLVKTVAPTVIADMLDALLLLPPTA